MAKLFSVNIVTPLVTVYSGKISSLIAPAESGYVGVLADHAPMVTTLGSGNIIVKESSGETKTFPYKGKGFLEVLNNEVTLLLEYVRP